MGPSPTATASIIGINTAIFSETGENTGIGFAIPIATAKKAADQLVNGQSVAKAGLGLSGPSATPNGDAGAYVQSVTEGGAAAEAGIQDGDLIVGVDGTPIRGFDELRGLISSHSPGETVTVTVVRDGERIDIEVTLGTLSSSSQHADHGELTRAEISGRTPVPGPTTREGRQPMAPPSSASGARRGVRRRGRPPGGVGGGPTRLARSWSS